MVDAELDEDHQILVHNLLLPVRPAPHASPSSALVRVLSSGIQLTIAILHSIDALVCKFCTLVIEAVVIREHLLKRRCVDLVRNGLVVDGIAHSGVLDLEDSVRSIVDVVAAGLSDEGLFAVVAGSVRVEVAAGHGVRFVVDKSVLVAVDHGIDAEGEDVLMVSGEDAWVDNRTPWDFEAFVDGLGRENTSGTDFVSQLTGLVEHESHNVLVVGNWRRKSAIETHASSAIRLTSDDALHDQLAVSYNSCTASAIVGVLPANPSVLFVNADNVRHVKWAALVIGKGG